MKIKLYQTGERVKDGKVVARDYKEIDSETISFCWLHPSVIRNLEDRKNLTPRDIKSLERITFKEGKSIDPDGTVRFWRSCPKCHNYVKIEPKRIIKPSLDMDIDNASNEIAQSNQMGKIL